MYTLHSRNLERSTRNSTKGRSAPTGPLLSPSYPNGNHLGGGTSLSPSRNKQLPPVEGNVNKGGSRDGTDDKNLPSPEAATKVKQPDNSIKSPALSQTSVICDHPPINDFPNVVSNSPKDVVGDITVVSSPDTLAVGSQTYFHDDTKETLKLLLADLQEIKYTTSKIPSIEEATKTFSKDLQGVIKRTTTLETALAASSDRVRELDEEVSTLKETVRKQELSLASLLRSFEDFSKSHDNKLQGISEAIGVQRERVESLQSASAHSNQEMLRVIDTKIDNKLANQSEIESQESHFHQLREQAFQNRFNLVISGLSEDKHKSISAMVKDFFSSTLNIPEVDIRSASRLGSTPEEGSAYARPILIKFNHLPHRNLVWRKRQTITGDDNSQKIRIHADLPKELREGVQSLYKVAKAASKRPQFQSAKVVNYQLELDGRCYLPSQLESLPVEIRPSTLASPRSEQALSFFSSNSILSNHYPSEFVIEDRRYASMEHYLAVKKALTADNPHMLQKAIKSKDPKQAKYILNALKGDHDELWYQEIDNIALEGLRAKFFQNPAMGEFLTETRNLQLGEASTNPRWGIGMTLDDPNVLDPAKWNVEGNLLGKLLMRVREELKQQPSRSTSEPSS